MHPSPIMQPATKKIFEIKSAPDPTGAVRARGIMPGFDLSTGKVECVLHYNSRRHGREFFLTADVYQQEGAPTYAVIYCPLCQNTLRITADNKQLEWEPGAQVKVPGYRIEEILGGLNVPSMGGRLSVEPFGCAWEVEPDLRRSYGFAVCPWRVAIDQNIVRDA